MATKTKMILTGDVNLMNVTDPTVPFALVRDEFRETPIVFSNLECCLYTPPGRTFPRTGGILRRPVGGGRGADFGRHRRGRDRQ